MGQKAGQARANKNRMTFWTRKRLDSQFTLRELSELSGIGYSTLSKYLTGQQMPPLKEIVKLCDLFNVDLDNGVKEFKMAHGAWKSPRRAKEVKADSEEIKPITVVPVKEVKPDDSILRAVYGIIPCSVFMEIEAGKVEETKIFEALYNKVDYDTFIEIQNKLKGGQD